MGGPNAQTPARGAVAGHKTFSEALVPFPMLDLAIDGTIDGRAHHLAESASSCLNAIAYNAMPRRVTVLLMRSAAL